MAWNILSTVPFEAGWYGAHRICLIPFCLKNKEKFSATNWGPLSETSCGKPYLAKISQRTVTVLLAVVVDTM